MTFPNKKANSRLKKKYNYILMSLCHVIDLRIYIFFKFCEFFFSTKLRKYQTAHLKKFRKPDSFKSIVRSLISYFIGYYETEELKSLWTPLVPLKEFRERIILLT